MRRKSKDPDRASHEFYIPRRGSATHDALALELGYLNLFWNCIEDELDNAFCAAVEVCDQLRIALRSRIGGLEGKYSIIKSAIGIDDFSDDERALLRESLGRFTHYKEVRDALVHVRIGTRSRDDYAYTYERRGARYEVLLSKDMIADVNKHLAAYMVELHYVTSVLQVRQGARPRRRSFQEQPQPVLVCETLIQRNLRKLHLLQEKRKSLPQLPRFEKGDSGSEET